jgi:hypothetical protein
MSTTPPRLRDVPLQLYGDLIIEQLTKMGFESLGLSITVGDITNGDVSGATNMTPEAELGLLKWVITEREAGRTDVVEQEKPN